MWRYSAYGGRLFCKSSWSVVCVKCPALRVWGRVMLGVWIEEFGMQGRVYGFLSAE